MRISQFWVLMEDEFGAQEAPTLARGHHLSALGDRTVDQALAEGVPPREVWLALVEDLQVPRERWLGRDRDPLPVPKDLP
ncbi:DUF3046 domain-containing protein [Janibacter sp. GXQ6167]|uniref:DUF3046 domain-containing protein n=1 Tax=Janibacter sp. GXQ6167 TaxID=3240791 RepID=UPI0035269E2A